MAGMTERGVAGRDSFRKSLDLMYRILDRLTASHRPPIEPLSEGELKSRDQRDACTGFNRIGALVPGAFLCMYAQVTGLSHSHEHKGGNRFYL